MIFIQQIDCVRDANRNDDWRDQTTEQSDFVTKKRNRAKRPNYHHRDHYHGEQYCSHRSEKQKHDEAGDDGAEISEHSQLSSYLLRYYRPYEGQACVPKFDSCVFRELVTKRMKGTDQLHPLRRVGNTFLDRHQHHCRTIVDVYQLAHVYLLLSRLFQQAIEHRL